MIVSSAAGQVSPAKRSIIDDQLKTVIASADWKAVEVKEYPMSEWSALFEIADKYKADYAWRMDMYQKNKTDFYKGKMEGAKSKYEESLKKAKVGSKSKPYTKVTVIRAIPDTLNHNVFYFDGDNLVKFIGYRND